MSSSSEQSEELNLVTAINQTLRQELARKRRVK